MRLVTILGACALMALPIGFVSHGPGGGPTLGTPTAWAALVWRGRCDHDLHKEESKGYRASRWYPLKQQAETWALYHNNQYHGHEAYLESQEE